MAHHEVRTALDLQVERTGAQQLLRIAS